MALPSGKKSHIKSIVTYEGELDYAFPPQAVTLTLEVEPPTHTGRTRIDSIKYKVDVNTMEHLSVENGKLKKEELPLQLNQIACVTFTTAKPLFFCP